MLEKFSMQRQHLSITEMLYIKMHFKSLFLEFSLVAQCSRVCLLMQETQV